MNSKGKEIPFQIVSLEPELGQSKCISVLELGCFLLLVINDCPY